MPWFVGVLSEHAWFEFDCSPVCTPESYMRRVVKPLEALLTGHKRVVVKDSTVSYDVACTCTSVAYCGNNG